MGATTARVASPMKVLAVLMALVVALAFIPSAAYAVSSKTVKKSEFQTSTKVIKKKATAVKKGTTKLTLKKGQGYIKFKATKTKKYKFTFSELSGSNIYGGFVEVQTISPSYPSSSYLTNVKTKGGKSNTLWLRTKNSSADSSSGVNKRLLSRTATIKLKKGQYIFFYAYTSSNTKAKMKLKIK